jgi:predicted PurR-regulated permease PerM
MNQSDHKWDITFRYIVLIAASIIILALAWSVRIIFTPLVWAAVIAYLLSPIVNLLANTTRLRRKTAARLVFFGGVTFIIIFLVFGIPVLLEELREVGGNLTKALEQVQLVLMTPANIAGVQISLQDLIPALRKSFNDALTIPNPNEALLIIESTSRGFLWVLVTLSGTYYLMTDWVDLRNWLIGLAPEAYQPDMHQLYLHIREVWMGYLRGQVLLMVIVGIVFTIVWSAIGLPGALVLGLLTGVFSLVPEIGPLATTVIAAIVALLQGSNFLTISNFWFMMLVIVLYTVLIQIKGIWLRPFIMGRSVNMHEGVVFLSIIAAVVTAGVLGALLIVPLLASAGVIGRYIRHKILGEAPFPDVSMQQVPIDHIPPKQPKHTNKRFKGNHFLRRKSG